MIQLAPRTLRHAAAALLLLTATNALAEEGVLVGEVPPGMTAPALVKTAESALVQRSWSVQRSDATSVDARRKGGGNDCTLTVFVSDGILKYRGSAKVAKAWGVGKDTKMIPVDGAIPGDWLDDLRSDIRQSLIAAIPRGNAAPQARAGVPPSNPAPAVQAPATAGKAAAAVAVPDANASTADKLKELEQLRKDGLVSEPEYQQMRKAILAKFTE